jgi:hypothetical protein
MIPLYRTALTKSMFITDYYHMVERRAANVLSTEYRLSTLIGQRRLRVSLCSRPFSTLEDLS